MTSAAKQPNERWSTDLSRVWGGRDGWLSLALMIDGELLGWDLLRSGMASSAQAHLIATELKSRRLLINK